MLNPRIFPEHVRSHLSKVYSTLLFLTVTFSIGTYFGTHMLDSLLFQKYVWILIVAPFIAIFMMAFGMLDKLVGSLGVALTLGMLNAPLITYTLVLDPSIVVIAALSTICIFLCMSINSYLSPSKKIFYVGGFLSSWLSTSIIIGFANLFFQSELVDTLYLYSGLILFIIYIQYDTQMMVDRVLTRGFDLKSDDYVMDALNLFLDAANIFIKIIRILIKLKGKRRKD